MLLKLLEISAGAFNWSLKALSVLLTPLISALKELLNAFYLTGHIGILDRNLLGYFGQGLLCCM